MSGKVITCDLDDFILNHLVKTALIRKELVHYKIPCNNVSYLKFIK